MAWDHRLGCDCAGCQRYRADNCRPGCDCGMCRKARREGSSCGGGCGCSSCQEGGAGAIVARVATAVVLGAIGIPDIGV